MVARMPTKEERRLDALRETVNKVNRAMERLHELQYAVTGGKVISGVTLSPRSTKGYIKTSIRCKEESLRIRNSSPRRCSTSKIAPCSSGEWRRMSLQAMLVGETVGEILQVSRFAKEAVDALSAVLPLTGNDTDVPKTPVASGLKDNVDKEGMKVKREREKQKMNNVSPLSGRLSSPAAGARRRTRSPIVSFKLSGEKTPASARRERTCQHQHSIQGISPKLRSSAAGTAVLFPNPAFQSSPSAPTRKSVPKSKSSPPPKFANKSPTALASKFNRASSRRERTCQHQHSIQRILPKLRSSAAETAVLSPHQAFQSSPSAPTRKSVPKSKSSPPPKFAIKSPTTLASKFNQASARRERTCQHQHSIQRILPKLRSSAAGTTVLFSNQAFQSSPSAPTCKSVPKSKSSPPPKFAIKSPTTLASKFTVKIRSPPVSVGSLSPSSRTKQRKRPSLMNPKTYSTPSKFCLSLSPSRFVKRLASPMKTTNSPLVQGNKKPPSRSQTTSVMSKAAKITRSLSPSNFMKKLSSPLKSRSHHPPKVEGGTLIPAIHGVRPSCSMKQRPVVALPPGDRHFIRPPPS